MAKIRATIAREWQQKGASVDWELLERMELHQKAVATAIAALSSGGMYKYRPTDKKEPNMNKTLTFWTTLRKVY